MHTLADLVEQARPMASLPSSGGVSADLEAKGRILVPGEGAIPLPRGEAGLDLVGGLRDSVAGLPADLSHAVRATLFVRPALVFPLLDPTAAELESAGASPRNFKHEKPRRVILACCTVPPTGQTLYGVAVAVIVENGLRLGASALLSFDDFWTEQIEELEDVLNSWTSSSLKSNFAIKPEANGRKWRHALALLGGSEKAPSLPPDWEVQLRLAAGLRRVNLDVRKNPDSSRRNLIRELRESAPAGLLVWVSWVTSPEVYLEPFERAMPGAYAGKLGTAEPESFSETLQELLLHLRAFSPLEGQDLPESDGLDDSSIATWAAASARIEELEGDHFRLSPRARRSLLNNSYPDPARMYRYVERLALLAADYRSGGGELGARLADVAISRYEIEIALQDHSINGRFEYEGVELDATPHVKVDDAKSPDECGRIYFARDKANLRIVVDHIGLHDYG